MYYATVKRSFSYGELERHIWTPPGLKGLGFEDKVASPIWVIYNDKGLSDFLVPYNEEVDNEENKKQNGFSPVLHFGEIRDKDPKTIVDNILELDGTFRREQSLDLRAVVCSTMEAFFKKILLGVYKLEQTSSDYMPGRSYKDMIERIKILI